MPKGKPRSDKQRKDRHKKKYGSLKSFPKRRRGERGK